MKSRTSQQRRWRLRALTLIEVLAVVCLIALAAGVTLTGLGGASTDAQLGAAMAECRQLDARARLLARGEGPIVIGITDDHQGLVARHADADAAGPPLLRAEAPRGWSSRLQNIQGDELSHLRIDAHGHSDDYTMELRPEEAGNGSPAARRLRVAGLTGWVEEVHGP